MHTQPRFRPFDLFILLIFSLVLTLGGQAAAQLDAAMLPPNDAAPPAESAEADDSQATKPGGGVPEEFNSPHATMRTFLGSINKPQPTDEDWRLIELSFDLPPGIASRMSDRAAALFEVLIRLGDYKEEYLYDRSELNALREAGEPIDQQRYFPGPYFTDVVKGVEPQGEITLVRIEEGPYRGYWKFSRKTLENIYTLLDSVDSLPILVESHIRGDQISSARWLRSYMPASLKNQYLLGLEYWQWLMLAVFILVGLVLDQIVRLALRIVADRTVARYKAAVDPELVSRVVKPLGLVAAALLWVWLTHLLSLPDTAYAVLYTTVTVFAVLATTWAAWRLVDLFAEVLAYKASRTTTRFDDVLVPLVRKTLKIFVVAFGLLYGAHSLHFNIVPLVTGLGIGGLAFAFAAKDTIENFFGSVAVVLDRPFEIGDWISVGDVEGIVEMVGFRSTRIRTFYNSQVTMPNANLVRANVDNYGRRQYRRWKTTLGVQYDTPPDKLVAFTEGIRELVRTHPHTRKDNFHIWVNDFGASSIDILVYIFFAVNDWAIELRERERLSLDIIRLADQLGVSFALPTQTVHLYREEHKPHEVKHQPPQARTEEHARAHGIRAAQQLIANQPWQQEPPGPVVCQPGPTRIDPDTDNIENRLPGK